MKKTPRILLLDIETAPMLGYVWGLHDQNVGLEQIKEDWHLLSFAAKWLEEPKMFYKDQREAKNLHNDKPILKELWKLMDEADIIVTQNGISFDHRKINARFILNGFKPPSAFRHLDTLRITRRHFAFSSHKLAYLTDKLCTQYKKLTHGEYEGFKLWAAVLSGDKKAWKVMEKYNKYDVLALEELYLKIRPWDNTIDLNAYRDDLGTKCSCGSSHIVSNGYSYTNSGKFKRYTCQACGRNTTSRTNLLTTEKKKALRA